MWPIQAKSQEGLLKIIKEDPYWREVKGCLRGGPSWNRKNYWSVRESPDGTRVLFLHEIRSWEGEDWTAYPWAESISPPFFDCPISYFSLVPPTNPRWRAAVLATFKARAMARRREKNG